MFASMLLLMSNVALLRDGPKEIGNSGFWITYDDYPADALRTRADGTSVIEITVDPLGHAARCRVVISSGTDSLDKTACAALARRGSWQPTLDGAGVPIHAIYRRRVVWVLPGDSAPSSVVPPDMEIELAKLPVRADQAIVVIRQIQRADGGEESCEVVSPSPMPALDRAACRLAAPLTKLEPIANVAGQLVRGARWRTIQFVEKAPKRVSKQ